MRGGDTRDIISLMWITFKRLEGSRGTYQLIDFKGKLILRNYIISFKEAVHHPCGASFYMGKISWWQWLKIMCVS